MGVIERWKSKTTFEHKRLTSLFKPKDVTKVRLTTHSDGGIRIETTGKTWYLRPFLKENHFSNPKKDTKAVTLEFGKVIRSYLRLGHAPEEIQDHFCNAPVEFYRKQCES